MDISVISFGKTVLRQSRKWMVGHFSKSTERPKRRSLTTRHVGAVVSEDGSMEPPLTGGRMTALDPGLPVPSMAAMEGT